MPTDALDLLALRQALEEADAVALGKQAVDVVEDERHVAIFPELAIKTEDGHVAGQPAGRVAQGLAEDAGLTQAVAADQDEEIEMPADKGQDHFLELEVGRQAYARRCGC